MLCYALRSNAADQSSVKSHTSVTTGTTMDRLLAPVPPDSQLTWHQIQHKRSASAAAIRHDEYLPHEMYFEGTERWLKVSSVQKKKRRFADFPVELIAKFLNNDTQRWIVQFSHEEYWVRSV